ncbi:MAG TPA: metalloregulator ArsR/SmtB family transcription factor [Thiobacillaceae bacterium]
MALPAPAPEPLPADPLALLATLLKGGGDPLRLAILQVLGQGSFGVLELCDILGLKQPAMSHHLKVLAQAGLVTARREGNAIYYRRVLPQDVDPAGAVQLAVFAALDALPLAAEASANIEQVRGERAESCRAFFARHAEDFRERQDLIAEYSQYADGARDLLLAAQLSPAAEVLEVGPGAGEFLAELAPRFAKVWAYDIAEGLLSKARNRIDTAGWSNVSLVAGDTRAAVKKGLRVDAVVFNMVLHHVPSPADLVRDAATLLKPGGVMLVTDLSRHEQDWVREHCGDLWQGFDDAELDRWARAAGFEAGESSYLGLRNGFQVLFRSFYRV